MSKTKLKKAPHFVKQAGQVNAFNDWLIFIGEKAHFAYYGGKNGKEAGKAAEWEMVRDVYHFPLDRHPVILGEQSFDEIDRLQLAPPEQTSIKIFQVGELPPLAENDVKTRLMMNLAANNPKLVAVEWLDLAFNGENLYEQIQRIRDGKDATAEILAQAQTQTQEQRGEITLDFESEKPTQPEIAEAFLKWRARPLRRDGKLMKLFEYNGTFWQGISEPDLMRELIAFYKAADYRKYSARSLKAIAELVAIVADEIPDTNTDLIGFSNGVLNKRTGEFSPHNINHYLRAIEKFNCNTNSTKTPYFDDWLDFVASDSPAKKQAILAGLYMSLTNRHEWGLMLEATGAGGAGKSILGQIATLINGRSNTAFLSLQELESDTKRAMLIGKSLAISPDQKPYTGTADELKAITGGDEVSVKLLYLNEFSVKLSPVFMLISNFPLYFSDRNGGIARRRVVIPFTRPIPKEKKDVYFIDKVQQEVYGIVNKLLAMFPDPEQARLILENYKQLDEGRGIKREANHLIDFLGHFELRRQRDKHALRLGSARSRILNATAGQDSLYSAYLYYCECHNLKALNVLAFKQALSDAFKEAGERVEYSEKPLDGHPTTNAYWRDRTLSLRQWEG